MRAPTLQVCGEYQAKQPGLFVAIFNNRKLYRNMKQRVAVRAIIRKGEQTLMLRRANGRSSILGKFELPGGRIDTDEQPEDALKRYISKDAGLAILSVQLFDVVSYIDPDDKTLQYIFIIYLVKTDDKEVVLSDNYDKYIWQTKSKILHNDITNSSKLLLGITNGRLNTEVSLGSTAIGVDKNTTKNDIIIYSDGGSRGNPGYSAAAYVIENDKGQIIESGGVYLGITTSQQAEYHGLLIGLERALELGFKSIEYRLDSMMVVNQMKGIYQIKNRDLWPINERIVDLLSQFDSINFVHVRREFNKLADGEVNRILDEYEKKTKK